MRLLRATLLAGILTALALQAPPAAGAATGSYEVSTCNYAPEGVNNSWSWATNDSSYPAHYAQHLNCPDRYGGNGGASDQEGGLSTADALGLANGAPPNTHAAWTFNAPASTTITAITYERYFGHELDPDNYWLPALQAEGTVIDEACLDTVADSESCFIGGPPDEGGTPVTITGLSTRQLSFGITCQAPSGQECITGATEHSAWAAMYGATVTLSDPTPPTFSEPSGSLWVPGYHHGTEQVQFAAKDTGGGVQRVVLSADGTPVGTYEAKCNFTFPQPCPLATGQQTLTLPTTELSDGTHTLMLTATDAAGNESQVATQQITVANDPPPPPTDLIAAPTQTGSSTFNVTWTNPADVAPITEATYQVCPASGSGACAEPLLAPADGPAAVTVPGPGVWTVAVWLHDAAGNSSPANAAHVTLTVTPEASHGGWGGGSNSIGIGSGSRNSGGNGSAAPKSKLHIAETVLRRTLTVRVTGPSNGIVKVNYTASYRSKVFATHSKTTNLRHGKLTVIFTLSARAAAHATIRISAQLGHDPPATSTLLRRHRSEPGGALHLARELEDDLLWAKQSRDHARC